MSLTSGSGLIIAGLVVVFVTVAVLAGMQIYINHESSADDDDGDDDDEKPDRVRDDES